MEKLRLENEYYDTVAASGKRTKRMMPRAPTLVGKRAVITYVLLFTFFVITSYSSFYDMPKGIFSAAFFIGLCYLRYNIAIITPLFIFASGLATFSGEGLICSAIVAAMQFMVYLFFGKRKIKMKLWHMNFLSFFCFVPYFFFYRPDILTSLISLALFYLSINALIYSFSGINRRGITNGFSTDEVLSLSVVFTFFCAGLYAVNFWGIYPFYIFVPLLLIVFLDLYGYKLAVSCALLSGLSASLVGGEPLLSVAFALSVCATNVFLRSGKLIAGITYVLVFVASCLYLDFLLTEELVVYIYFALAVTIYELIPSKFLSRFRFSFDKANRYTAGSMANRMRFDVGYRLKKVSQAFVNMSQAVKNTIVREPSEEGKIIDICNIMKRQLCDTCILKDDCERYAGDTATLFYPLAVGAVANGEATILDVGSHLAGNCHKVQLALSMSTELAGKVECKTKDLDAVNSSKLLMSEQARELATIVSSLAEDISSNVTYNKKLEKQLADDLIHNGIIIENVLVAGKKNSSGCVVTVTLKSLEKNTKSLAQTVSRSLKRKMVVSGSETPVFNGLITVQLTGAPRYEIAYAERIFSKNNASENGDSKCVRKINDDKILACVSDGMGNGADAERFSRNAITMIESFYEAGFENRQALTMCNKLLAMSGSELYSAMDICAINLNSGKAELIKLGSPPTYIMSDKEIDIITNESLPMGIVEDACGMVKTRLLKSKDIILFISDGIADILSDSDLRRILTLNGGLNPERIADAIEREATPYLRDDATAVVLRVI